MAKHPSLAGLTGRYEFHDDSINSHKYWTLTYDKREGTYTTAWGRIGSRGQAKPGLSGDQALKKVQEKISKGYKLIKKDGTKMGGVAKKKKAKKKEDTQSEVLNFLEELKKI